MPGWDLRTKMAVVLVGLVLVTSVVPTAIFYSRLSEELVDRKFAELERDSDLQGLEFTLVISGLRDDVAFLASTPPIGGIARAQEHDGLDPLDGSTLDLWTRRLEVIFLGLLRSKKTYLQVRLIGLQDGGREIVRVDRYGPGQTPRILRGPELQRKGDRDYVQEVVRDPGRRLRLSAIDLNREDGRIVVPHDPVIRASTPVFDEDGALFGIVVINASMQAVLDRFVALRSPLHAHYVTNERGQLLWHPDEERAFRFEFGDPSHVLDEFPALAEVLGGERSVAEREYVAAGGRPTLSSARAVAYDPEDPSRWLGLVLEAQRASVTSVALATARHAALWSLPCLALALLAALLVAHRIYTPIAHVATGMTRVRLDDDSEGIEAPASYEAHLLATTFNQTFQGLKRTASALRRTNEELEQFAFVAAHDLREPARSVRSLAGLLLERHGEGVDAQGRQILDFMVSASDRMLELIASLLEHSTIGRTSEVEAVDCNQVVREVLDDLASAIEESGAQVSVSELPTLRGGATDLRLLFQNLLANALKFRRPGEAPRIELGCAEREVEVELWVSDNGVGIPRDRRQKVFEIFQRAHAGQEYVGCGIGLAHCKKIVELQNGAIWIEDSPSGGTKVCMLFPRDLSSSAAKRSATAPAP